MQWLPDQAWIAFLVLIASLHFISLARLTGLKLRIMSLLVASWYWILVSVSLSRMGWATGIGAYSLAGALALFAAIYLSAPHRQAA